MSSPTRLVPLADSAALLAWLERSHLEPVLIFKHSLTCGTSAAAYAEIERFLGQAADAPPCGLIVVQTERAVSNQVAELFSIAHRSPQAFLVIAGAVCWHASHGRITSHALAGAAAAARTARAQA